MKDTTSPKPNDQQVAGWSTWRATITVALFCVALIGGVAMRSRLDLKGVHIASHSLGGLVAQNTVQPSQIPLITYYQEIEQMLKDKYVEKIGNEEGLAVGAIRGMVNSLAETHSNFLNPKLAKAFFDRQRGDYAGIGVSLETRQMASPSIIDASALHPTSDVQVGRVPDLIVDSIAPGSPADLAGLKIGDQVDSINGHWVINQTPLTRLEVLAKKAPTDKSASAKFNALLIKLRKLADNSMTANRAMEQLETGTNGKITVTVLREGSPITKTMNLAQTNSLENGVEADKAVRLRFASGAESFLQSKLDQSNLTIDLRNQPEGSFEAMSKCLALILPTGTYGTFVSQRGEQREPYKLDGNGKTRNVKLLVDASTKGSAAIFALALKNAGVGTLIGNAPLANPTKVKVNTLSDGSAYTLATGVYSPIQQAGGKK